MRRWIVPALTLLLVSGCVVVRRARSYPSEAEITTVEWYKPLEAVPGRPAPPLAKTSAVPADALETVRAWAEARETTALVVLHDGALAYEWYAPGHDATSTTNAMSMTKTVIALVVGAAIADGSIGSVDDPVGRYVPELRDERGEITIRQLLEMSSGLRNDQRLQLGSDIVALYLGPRVEQRLLQIPAERLPGYAFDYNNANTQLLALVVERATGQRLAEYLSSRIWRPIGAGDAAFWLDRPNGTARAFCCFFATPRDWARLGQMLLDDGRVGPTVVIPHDYLARMTLPSEHNPDYGWHVWRAENGPGSTRAEDRTEPFLDDAMFWLDGRGTQRVYVVPRERLVIVRVGEEPPDWDEAVLPNTLVRALREARAEGPR